MKTLRLQYSRFTTKLLVNAKKIYTFLFRVITNKETTEDSVTGGLSDYEPYKNSPD